MIDELPQLKIERKTGDEQFRRNGQNIDLTLLDFWRWYASDLVDNTKRGILAEFIVANALGCVNEVCNIGDAYDMEMPTGEKIEVKSAAYLQSWYQKRHSTISFTIGQRRKWDASIGEMDTEIKRQADIYVFCLLKHKDKGSVNPLDLDQWHFYILAASVFNEACPNQEKISLESLRKLKPHEATYEEIKPCIEKLIEAGNKV
jgi:hypothetical protein